MKKIIIILSSAFFLSCNGNKVCQKNELQGSNLIIRFQSGFIDTIPSNYKFYQTQSGCLIGFNGNELKGDEVACGVAYYTVK